MRGCKLVQAHILLAKIADTLNVSTLPLRSSECRDQHTCEYGKNSCDNERFYQSEAMAHSMFLKCRMRPLVAISKYGQRKSSVAAGHRSPIGTAERSRRPPERLVERSRFAAVGAVRRGLKAGPVLSGGRSLHLDPAWFWGMFWAPGRLPAHRAPKQNFKHRSYA
jgi:hypothetical protein